MSKGVRLTKSARFDALRKFVENLRALAGDEVVKTTLDRTAHYINGRLQAEMGRHVRTGMQLATAQATSSGASIDINLRHYYRFSKTSWRKGIPPTVIQRAQAIFLEEARKRLAA